MVKVKNVLPFFLLTTLALYAVAGLLVYPLADDLMFIQLAKMGNPVADQYMHWRGSYSFSFLSGVVMPLAPFTVVRLAPALMLVSGVAVLYLLLRRVVQHPLLASAGLTLAFLLSLPDVWQSFFWFSAANNYVLPLILAGGVLWVLSR